ncbi:MAG: hypothetical protein U9Q15_03100 [Patescibacteria group bacterium]|nr:hypothetical protein [Patescibacteria group bacterium]
MGIGDPLLALAAAFLLGNIPHIILFLYLTFLLPFFLVLAKIIRYRSYQKIRKDSLPLGPYILIALALSFLNQYFSWIPVNDIWIAL